MLETLADLDKKQYFNPDDDNEDSSDENSKKNSDKENSKENSEDHGQVVYGDHIQFNNVTWYDFYLILIFFLKIFSEIS